MIFLEQSVLDEMTNRAESTTEECCGFFFGYETGGDRRITQSMPASNAGPGNRCTNFEIALMDYLNAERWAVRENLLLLGIYHSHPNYPAIPSEFDREAAQSFFNYLILSVMNQRFDEVRSWQLDDDGQWIEEKINIVHSLNQPTAIYGDRYYPYSPA
jgi:proteasome lid subunit RPN8/RPN11